MGGGGYAPFYPAPYPVYAPPPRPWVDYASPPAWDMPEPPYANQWDTDEGFSSDRATPPADIKKAMEDSAAERKQAIKAAKARQAAFHAMVKAQRAAAKARRDAWEQQLGTYPPSYAPAAVVSPPVATKPQVTAVEPPKAEQSVVVRTPEIKAPETKMPEIKVEVPEAPVLKTKAEKVYLDQ